MRRRHQDRQQRLQPQRPRPREGPWITTRKVVAFGIVQEVESCGLTADFYIVKMKLGEHPRKCLLRVDQNMVKELDREECPMDPKDVDIVILSDFAPQYDAVVRMQESPSD